MVIPFFIYKYENGENNMEKKHTLGELYQMQSLSLDAKIRMTQRRIKD